jgi:hypothetical protein
MNDLYFMPHARVAMSADRIPEEGEYHVVGDADVVHHYDNGRTEYVGIWDGRTFSVILEDDEVTVVTVFEHERQRRRRRG